VTNSTSPRKESVFVPVKTIGQQKTASNDNAKKKKKKKKGNSGENVGEKGGRRGKLGARR